MTQFDRLVRRLSGNSKGATIIEFALLAPCLLVVLFGMLDLGLRVYVAVQLAGALEQAARQVTVMSASSNAAITDLVRKRIQLIIPRASVVVTPVSYYDFVHVGKPEPITTDIAPVGKYNKGDCFQDLNGDGSWSSNSGATGTGGSEDVVYYKATVTYPNLLPLGSLLGRPPTTTLNDTTMMRNQPYASQPDPAVICS